MEKININNLKEIEVNNGELDLFEELKSAEIREENPPKYFEPLLKIQARGYKNYKSVLTLSNISVIKGKAKSRKTFASTILMNACLYGGNNSCIDNIFISEIPGNVIYFDTEQGDYHVHKVIQRVSGMNNENMQSDFFAGFALRKYEPEKRIKLIETCIYRVPNIKLVVIDGIRDLIYDINDQKESTILTTKLMKWSKDVNCHICVVLHENKADGSARGAIGTEVTNKSETVFKIEKEGNYSTIIAEYTRDEDFTPLRFIIEKTDKCFIPKLQFYEPEF